MKTPPATFAPLLALADRDPRRAVRLSAPDPACPPDRWQLYNHGYALLRWERVSTARTPLVQAQRLAQQAGDTLLDLRCTHALILVEQLQGAGLPLQDGWETLLAQLHQHDDWDGIARALCDQIWHLNMLFLFPRAWKLAQAALDRRAAFREPLTAAWCAQVGGVAAAGVGELDTADLLLAEAYTAFLRQRAPIQAARVLFDRAWLAQRREAFEQTRADAARALRVFRRADLPLRIALCVKDLGIAAAYLGDYATAVANATSARDQFRALGRFDLVARCDQNLGVVAYYAGLWELARAAYQRAATTYRASENLLGVVVCQRNQALVLIGERRSQEALALLESLEPELAAVGDQIEVAEVALVRAEALEYCGMLDQATAALAEAERRFAAHGHSVAAAKCQLSAAWLLLHAHQDDAAAARFAQVMPQLSSRPVHAWRITYGLATIAARRGDHAEALRAYAAAGALVAELRQQLVSVHASSGIFLQAQQLYVDALRLARRTGDPDLLLTLVEQQRALALQRQLIRPVPAPNVALQTAYEARRAELLALTAAAAPPTELDPAFAAYLDSLLQLHHASPQSATPAAQLDLPALRARLTAAYGSSWTVLAPTLLDDELLLLTVTPTGTSYTAVPYDPEFQRLVTEAVKPSRRLVTYRNLVPVGPPWATLRALGDRLITADLRSRLGPDHHLVIVPASPLHSLPWAALRLGETWLCEQALLHSLPALTLPVGPPAEPSGGAQAALLLGCTAFGERAVPLPRAPETLEAAAQHWPGPVTQLTDAAATRAALLELARSGALRDYRLIHIASHAHLGSRSTLGHIKLHDDDILIDELVTLGLHDVTVVLAACDGAASDVLPGEEVVSIDRALLAAGASSVVASVWPVFDQMATVVYARWYAEIAAGHPPALALALTQRACCAGASGSIVQTPYFWGGFKVTERI